MNNEQYEPEHKSGKGHWTASDLDSIADILAAREKMIESVAAQGQAGLTRELCSSLRRDAQRNFQVAQECRNRGYHLIAKALEYLKQNQGNIPQEKAERAREEFEETRIKVDETFGGHQQYLQNYLPDFITEQTRIAEERQRILGTYEDAA
ncbi:MAG: hypothetical protein KKB21_02630 [Nanoarchaeota archaeon]|nr:hypothetical protein [Nanoarchaeota archaeon]MBU4086451.1 hypothetical protein [Nanoarchaeota archaeon]